MAVGLALLVVGERGWLCASTSVMEESLIGLDGRLVRDILLPVFLLMLLLSSLSSLTSPGLLLMELAKLALKSAGMLLEKTEGSAVSLGRDLDDFQSGFLTFL